MSMSEFYKSADIDWEHFLLLSNRVKRQFLQYLKISFGI